MKIIFTEPFTDSLSKLTVDEQKLIKIKVFEYQLDPTNSNLKFKQLKKAKDSNLRRLKVDDDMRIILHKTGDTYMFCYVAHHDRAYNWEKIATLKLIRGY